MLVRSNKPKYFAYVEERNGRRHMGACLFLMDESIFMGATKIASKLTLNKLRIDDLPVAVAASTYATNVFDTNAKR